jgi:hypothetical protein
MTRNEYNVSGVQGVRAFRQNKASTVPLRPELARRSPVASIVEAICRKAAKCGSPAGFAARPVYWTLEPLNVQYRPLIVAALENKTLLIAEPVGSAQIRIIGAYPELE